MQPDPIILGFDTSAAHVAAAVVSGGQVQVDYFEDRAKGQDQALFQILEDLLRQAGCDWRSLNGLAVGVGPGNFTGVRIAVSAAKGLAMSLGLPLRGVTGFEQALFFAPKGSVAVIAGPRGQTYLSEPGTGKLCSPEEAANAVMPYAKGLVGSGAQALGDLTGLPTFDVPHAGQTTALVASADWDQDWLPAKPLYLKSADAAISSKPVPVIV